MATASKASSDPCYLWSSRCSYVVYCTVYAYAWLSEIVVRKIFLLAVLSIHVFINSLFNDLLRICELVCRLSICVRILYEYFHFNCKGLKVHWTRICYMIPKNGDLVRGTLAFTWPNALGNNIFVYDRYINTCTLCIYTCLEIQMFLVWIGKALLFEGYRRQRNVEVVVPAWNIPHISMMLGWFRLQHLPPANMTKAISVFFLASVCDRRYVSFVLVGFFMWKVSHHFCILILSCRFGMPLRMLHAYVSWFCIGVMVMTHEGYFPIECKYCKIVTNCYTVYILQCRIKIMCWQ